MTDGWSSESQRALVEAVHSHHKVLFGSFSGCGGTTGVSKVTNEKGWREVADVVNATQAGFTQTPAQVKKKYANLRFSVKRKKNIFKRVPTGGGPAPKVFPFTPVEQMVHDFMIEKQTCLVVGIAGGVDTASNDRDISLEECKYIIISLIWLYMIIDNSSSLLFCV